MTKDSLLFLTKEDFDRLKFPSDLGDIILSELQKSNFFKYCSFHIIEDASKFTPIIEQMSNLSVQATNCLNQSRLEQDIFGPKNHQPENSDPQNQEVNPNPDFVDENVVGLRGFIDDCSTFEEALEILNIEGARNGVSFKRGNIHYYDNSKVLKDKRIICSQTSRNKSRIISKDTESKKKSLDQIKHLKTENNVKDCPVYYKFSFNKEDSKMSFSKCNETHNHPLVLAGSNFTPQMMSDLQLYNKKSKIIDIKESLEKKYNVILDYQNVYYAFRKIFPRLRDEDANSFVNMLEKKYIYHKMDIIDSKIQRLFLATPRMVRNYELYGDIILIDSTYRVNQYNIPLVVYSGVDFAGITFFLASH